MYTFITRADPKFRDLWSEFLSVENRGCGPKMSLSARDYYAAFCRESLLEDLSFVVSKGTRVVAIVPLLLEKIQNRVQFSQFNEYLPFPCFSRNLGENEREQVERDVFIKIEALCDAHKVKRAFFIENAMEKINRPFAMNHLDKHGWVRASFFTNLIDLTRPLASLWPEIRHSYRAMINKTLKKYEFVLYDSKNFTREVGERYRLMHRKAAGRDTRPLETFERMYSWISSGQGFLVEQRLKDKPLSYALIMREQEQLFYASFAEDAETPEERSSLNAWVWFAIEQFHSRKFQYLEMGQLWFSPTFGRMVSKKTVGISRFKAGYGGLFVPTNEYIWISDAEEFQRWEMESLDAFSKSRSELFF